MILQCGQCNKSFDSNNWEWEEDMPPEEDESYWCGHGSLTQLAPCEP